VVNVKHVEHAEKEIPEKDRKENPKDI